MSWCPRNPAVIAGSSFDHRVSIYSLMGGQQQVQPTSNIADSFPGMETMQPVEQTARSKTQTVQLKQPPKWLRRPCGASFGFGGKLVTFEKEVATTTQQGQTLTKSVVKVGKVVTEEAIVQRSTKLETSLQNDNMYEFCEAKIADTSSVENQQVWRFIKANFESESRSYFLSLLGYDQVSLHRSILTSTKFYFSSF